jgi:acetylornithine deacetylase/succinyl-diaminopimelate desuccinylase-like protein
MARFLLRLPEGLPDRRHPLVGGPTINAALIEGGSAPNVVPDRCVVDIDRRVIPGERDPDEVLEPLRAVVAELRRDDPELRIDLSVREWTDAAESPPDGDVANVVRAAALDETGATPADAGFSGITDARYYINGAGIPAVIFGPGSMSVAHTADEWVPVNELVAAARVYARAFVGFLGA